MKTFLRIIILLVATLVAIGFYFAANNSTTITDSGFEGGQHPAMTDANGQTIQLMERPDHDEGGVSLAGGLGGVLGTLAKVAGITVLITLIKKAFDMLKRRKPSFAS